MSASTVGTLLREWRSSRGVSQADLAATSGFSSRHVSFIETGRTSPSRDALLALAEALDVPLRDRNHLLQAGGFAQVYPETPLAADTMAPVRGLLQFILDRHLPYPALVLDRHATCLMANRAAGHLLSLLIEPPLLAPGANQLRVLFHPDGVRRWVVNWEQVRRQQLTRAERELGAAADATGRALLDEIRGYAGGLAPASAAPAIDPHDVLLPLHLRRGDLELRLVTGVMTLGTPQDVTLQELRLETFFPADTVTEQTWARVFPGGGANGFSPASAL